MDHEHSHDACNRMEERTLHQRAITSLLPLGMLQSDEHFEETVVSGMSAFAILACLSRSDRVPDRSSIFSESVSDDGVAVLCKRAA
jgi:hypothetical protein